MGQRDKFKSIITKHEDQLIAKILIYIRDFRGLGIASPINNSWRQTISDYSRIVINAIEVSSESNNQSFIVLSKENYLLSFTRQEVNRCLQRNILPHLYLSFIKIVRKAYCNIIQDCALTEQEKNMFINVVNECFDSLEISFSNAYNCNENERIKSLSKNNTEKKLFEIVYDHINLPILIISPLQTIVRSNKVGKVLAQLWEKDPKNQQIYSKIDGREIIHAKIGEFLISQNPESNFETSLRMNGNEKYYQVKLSKLRESENILACFIDCTKWKDIESKLEKSCEKAENSNKLKTTYLANMSHEIRTPMNSIVGFSELLIMSNPTNEERIEYLTIIKNSSNDLLNIIEDVIDIAKIESKQLKISPKNTSLFEILEDLNKIYCEFIVRHGKENVTINLRVLENEKKISIRTDPKRLKQALSNLIGNAIKFTKKGQIEIGYKVAQDNLIYFFVKDTGTGIPYNMQDKVFDCFTQIDQDNPNGSGLGLSICKNIINLLGGNIWVSSVPDKGSNFYFYLPYIETSETPAIPELKRENPNKAINLKGFKILIAEDEEVNYFYLKESLRNTGIEIIRAKNGIEAINLSESDAKINLILMDIKMPEVNGIDATRYISHTRPDLPIIAITAYAMESDRKLCLDAGCIDYISKPVMRDKLIQMLDKYLLQTKKEQVNTNI